jgi:endonuclease YncB( thermonuclease family)
MRPVRHFGAEKSDAKVRVFLPSHIKAVDGDSLRIRGQRVRLAGIGAPELRQTWRKDKRKPYPYGVIARIA